MTASIAHNDGVRLIAFAGTDDRRLVPLMRSLFPQSAVILNRLTVRHLAAAHARLAVFVSNDTGPLHIAAAVGAPVVLLLDRRAPDSYLPVIEANFVFSDALITEISTEEVYEATRALLAAGRTETLF